MSSKIFCPHGVWDEYPCDECGTDLAASVATYNLERAVIEAAEALVGEDIDAKRYWRLRDSLRAAVEALQEARDE